MKQQGISLTAFGVLFICTAFLASDVSSEPLRHRRQVVDNYVIDTLVVVDDDMRARFEQWFATQTTATDAASIKSQALVKLREYVSLVVHQANVRLKTLENHISSYVTIQVNRIDVGQNILGPFGPSSSEDALDTFRTWISSNSLGTQYDHAILFTGHTLSNNPTTSDRGRAYIGGMCRQSGFSTSVVQDQGGFQSAFFVAHEIGHSLGSEHDGEGKSILCKAADRFLMTPLLGISNPATQVNPWYFSPCSANSIDTTISGLVNGLLISNLQGTPNCFKTTLAPAAEFTATANAIAGQLYPADEQCRMMYGSASHVCFGGVFGGLDDICTAMSCYDPALSSGKEIKCAQHFAAEGTTCGNRKLCKMGRCVDSDAAPTVGECPTGDDSTLINGQFTCSEFVANNPSTCYQKDVRDICCLSCLKRKTAFEECPYGDKVPGCSAQSCQIEANVQRCCGTCFYDVTDPDTGSGVSDFDAAICAERIVEGGAQSCDEPKMAAECPQTCSEFKTVSGENSGRRLSWAFTSTISMAFLWVFLL